MFTQTGGTNTVAPADGGLTYVFDADAGFDYSVQDGALYVGTYIPGGTGTYDLEGGILNADAIYVSEGSLFKFDGGTANFNTFGLYAAATASGNEVIGTAANPNSIFTQYASQTSTASSNTISGALVLGDDSGATGTYDLEDGSLSAIAEMVGFAGTGVFTQQAGVNTIGQGYAGTTPVLDPDNGMTYQATDDALAVGFDGAGTGTYDLEGGTLNTFYIFVNNGSTFEFNGGTANFASFQLYDTSTVTASGNEVIGTTASPYSSSEFDQWGGSNSITGALVLGDNSAATGIYNLISPGDSLSATAEIVGFAGTGAFTQYSGTNIIGPADGNTTDVIDPDTGGIWEFQDGALYVGANSGGTGTYDLEGGTLTANAIYNRPGSLFEFNGGTANFNSFELDATAAVTASGNEVIGTTTNPNSTFTQFGGSNTITGALVLGDDSGATGTYDLEDGSLKAANVLVGDGGAGTFDLQGGTLTADSITIENGSTFEFDGGTLNFNSFVITGGGLADFAVAFQQDVTFSGPGTLELGQRYNGTIFGFAPGDTIDLAGAAYDASAVATLDSTDNVLTITEDSGSYQLQLDPSQVFLTTPTFKLGPDSSTSANPGTDLTVVEPPVTGEYLLSPGQTSDGIVIGSGGKVVVEGGATINSAVVQSGATLLGDAGSTVNDSVIDYGGVLDLATGAAASGTINFGPPVGDPIGGTLEIDDTTELNATITGFAPGDTIDLTAIQYDPSGSANLVSGNVLDVNEDGNTYTLQFDPTQDFTGDYFHLAPDSGGTGTDITENTTPCYCRGTLIQTQSGQKCLENLKIGDEVVTMSGVARPIKWIGKRSYGGRFVIGRTDILPVCIKAGALDDNIPRRDLWISPHHAMFFAGYDRDGVLIEAKDLVNGVTIVQAERVENVEYFHVELETHDVIIAEGALSETFIDDGSRGMFHNAHEYSVLYPAALTTAEQYCAPRIQDGYEIEAIRRHIALRAGLVSISTSAGQLQGYVDWVTPRVIEGWAQNIDHPEAPVCLDIYAGSQLIGQLLANRYREDLKRAGIGSGFHSFRFTPPDGIALVPDAVDVRRSLDQAVLPLSSQARRTGTSAAA